MSFAIRRLIPDDARAWWTLRLEALQNDPLAFGQTAAEHEALPLEVVVERLQEKENAFTLGAFEGEQLIGMMTLLRDTAVTRRHKSRIVGVYVTPSHRGRGVADAMLSMLIKQARRDCPGLEQIGLTVAAHNDTAARLYRRFGFTSFGVEPAALKIGTEYVDEDHMILRL